MSSLHAVLLVKEYDAHGDLKIDRTSQMANWDVPQIIINGLTMNEDERLYPWKSNKRERLSVYGTWDRSKHPKNEFEFSHVYSIEGPLYKKESIKEIKPE